MIVAWSRSAWDDAIPKEPSRRVRYDRAGVRTDSHAVSVSRIEMIP